MAEMKPEDVIKALECCVIDLRCHECPYFKKEHCVTKLHQETLALICEKDAEIQELVDGWSKDQEHWENLYDEKDAEVERLLKELHYLQDQIPTGGFNQCIGN